MPTIPSSINGVTVEFSSAVNKTVDHKVIDGLKKIAKPAIETGYKLTKIHIFPANDQHEAPSRHVQGNGKAVYISRINESKLSLTYSTNATVKAIVNAMQTEFENFTYRRENVGPFLKKRLGSTHTISGHSDHMHFSVN